MGRAGQFGSARPRLFGAGARKLSALPTIHLPARTFMARLKLAAGVVGPVLFVIVFLIEGATRPGYNAWRHFVSQLSTSDQGWEQVANFIMCGALVLLFVSGLRAVLGRGKGMALGPVLLGIFGLGLVVAGIFVTDPALGYPPGVPVPVLPTLHGTIHGLAGLAVFVSLPLACFALARRFAGDPRWRGWAAYSIVTGLLVLASFVAANVASVLDATGAVPNAPTGLLQRLGIILGWGWIALLALRLLRREGAAGGASLPGSRSRADT
jgi:hypothetical protein